MLSVWNTVPLLDRLLEDMGPAVGTGNPGFSLSRSTAPFRPDVDVHVSDEEIAITCDVPGLKLQDLDVTLENHVLLIKGTRRYVAQEKAQGTIERRYGSFSRSFTLPESLDEEHLSADLNDGVLTIRVPRLAKAQPKKIAIQVTSTQELKGA